MTGLGACRADPVRHALSRARRPPRPTTPTTEKDSALGRRPLQANGSCARFNSALFTRERRNLENIDAALRLGLRVYRAHPRWQSSYITVAACEREVVCHGCVRRRFLRGRMLFMRALESGPPNNLARSPKPPGRRGVEPIGLFAKAFADCVEDPRWLGCWKRSAVSPTT